MIPVEEAVSRITSAFSPLPVETVPLQSAFGRTGAEDIFAAVAQPPQAVSAMDGFAVRSNDKGARAIIGEAAAGHPFAGRVGEGQAVRIFTGAVLPDGADAIAIQENASVEGDLVRFSAEAKCGQCVREAGLDFGAGDILVQAGRILSARDLALLAAGDAATISVRRRPVIAFAATGDELSLPGCPRKPGGIVASSGFALAALIESWGGLAKDLGILPDKAEAIAGLGERASSADLILTLGGASVGKHDLVQQALGPKGFSLDFWKIAMRPGKPLIFGRLAGTPLIGLPGNPVSALVCALLFVRPAIAAMLGRPAGHERKIARLDGVLAANDTRQDYLRASTIWREGALWARPQPVQDSSMLKVFAQSDALIIRAPHAPALEAGAEIEILSL